VRVVPAFRSPIAVALAAMAMSGCMQTGSSLTGSQADPGYAASGEPRLSADESGEATGALSSAFATTPRSYAPQPIASARSHVLPGRPALYNDAYHLDTGDKLRIVIYGEEALTNTYTIDAGGSISMPLIGQVAARSQTTAGLANAIAAKLRNGYVREPSVAVEIEAYRPFFIVGAVAAPGQYPYVPNMTVESAVAIAGGFTRRARRNTAVVSHPDRSGSARFVVPLGAKVGPGDTVYVAER
jgi:polysaccharide biosynthesis/export protein